MKRLSDFIAESLNPRGSFEVVKPLSTDFMWEYYKFKYGKSDDPDALERIYKESRFEKFYDFAKKEKWDQDEKGYFIIPVGTKLKFVDHMASASWLGMFEIDNSKVYVVLMYDDFRYGTYDEYLKKV